MIAATGACQMTCRAARGQGESLSLGPHAAERTHCDDLERPGSARIKAVLRRGTIVGAVGAFDHIAAVMQASPVSAELFEMATSGDFSRLDRNPAKRQHIVP